MPTGVALLVRATMSAGRRTGRGQAGRQAGSEDRQGRQACGHFRWGACGVDAALAD